MFPCFRTDVTSVHTVLEEMGLDCILKAEGKLGKEVA